MKLADISRGVVLGGRFRLVDLLGDGSFGYVWKAEVVHDASGELPKYVALKIFKNVQSGNKLLFREALLAQQFACDRLVRVFGCDRLDGLPMMWMEYVDGQSLYHILGTSDAPTPYPQREVLGWLRDLAEALAHMHAADPPIGHGDLKLDNILIHPEEGAKLIDFGLSKPLEAKFVDTNGNGAYPYWAPEIVGKGETDPGKRCIASDIYAAGVIAYRILTGRFPRSTWSECLQQVPFPRARDLNSSIPTDLDLIVSKCLEKKPENRYQTGCELLAAVENLIKQTKSSADFVQVPRPEHIPAPAAVDELLEFAQRLLVEGKVDDAMVRLESGMQRMSTSPRVLLVYGEALRRVGNFQTALVAYSRALRWMEQHSWPDSDKRDAIEGLGEVNVRLKRYEQAVKHFERLAETWPDHHWFRYRYGVSLALEASDSSLRKSIDVLQSLYEERPSALIAAKIGKAYEELRQIEQASQYYNEALMLDQYEPTALFQLGRLRAIQGRMDKADECLERLRQIEGAEDEACTLVRLMSGE
jgi:tetratricopeptide (TPR) repeat protein